MKMFWNIPGYDLLLYIVKLEKTWGEQTCSKDIDLFAILYVRIY
jgi:hypothetical protein